MDHLNMSLYGWQISYNIILATWTTCAPPYCLDQSMRSVAPPRFSNLWLPWRFRSGRSPDCNLADRRGRALEVTPAPRRHHPARRPLPAPARALGPCRRRQSAPPRRARACPRRRLLAPPPRSSDGGIVRSDAGLGTRCGYPARLFRSPPRGLPVRCSFLTSLP